MSDISRYKNSYQLCVAKQRHDKILCLISNIEDETPEVQILIRFFNTISFDVIRLVKHHDTVIPVGKLIKKDITVILRQLDFCHKHNIVVGSIKNRTVGRYRGCPIIYSFDHSYISKVPPVIIFGPKPDFPEVVADYLDIDRIEHDQ